MHGNVSPVTRHLFQLSLACKCSLFFLTNMPTNRFMSGDGHFFCTSGIDLPQRGAGARLMGLAR